MRKNVKLRTPLPIIAIVIIFAVIGAANTSDVAVAGELRHSSYTFVFDGTEPTFETPNNNCIGASNYQLVEVTFSVSDYYIVTDSSPADLLIDIYAETFDPANPSNNFVDYVDRIDEYYFSAGETYVFVVTHDDDCIYDSLGTITISGLYLLPNRSTEGIFEGVFTLAAPTFLDPGCEEDYGGGGDISPVSNVSVQYLLFGPYTPTVSGDYYFTDLMVNLYEEDVPGAVDIWIDVYENGFNPNNPEQNFVDDGDDADIFTLTAGVPYYFVISEYYCQTDIAYGFTQFWFYGPGSLIPAGGTIAVNNIALVSINTTQVQMVYQEAGGDPIRNDLGGEVFLPHDADGNGYDTYVVDSTQTLDGRVWLAIWLGSNNLGWVPLDGVTVIAGTVE